MTNFRNTGFIAKPRNPVYTVGKKYRTIPARAALLTASMVNGDTFELGGPFTSSDRIARIFTPNATPALTGATDSKLGFMKKVGGVLTILTNVANANQVLWNNATLAAALSSRDLLTSINTALNTTLNIGELLGLGPDQEPDGGYFLVLTFPTKPSVDGVLDLEVWFEEATTN